MISDDMTMIVVEDPTTITSEIQTRQLVVGTTMITLLLSSVQDNRLLLFSDLEKLFQKQFLCLYYLMDAKHGASPSFLNRNSPSLQS